MFYVDKFMNYLRTHTYYVVVKVGSFYYLYSFLPKGNRAPFVCHCPMGAMTRPWPILSEYARDNFYCDIVFAPTQ